MKLVDLLGCGVPVASLDYKWCALGVWGLLVLLGFIVTVAGFEPRLLVDASFRFSIGELVQPRNGLLFSDSFQLANILMTLFRGFPHESHALQCLKNGAVEASKEGRWNEEWEAKVMPVLNCL